jgi:ATP-binding cassette subfamily B protein
MLMAPILGSFYDFAVNYSIKLIVDIFSSDQIIKLETLYYPMGIFICAQILLDVVWRVADIAEWRSEPYVRESILMQAYEHVQKSSYAFFQNNPQGMIASKIKGLLDGYDHFWAAMHHDFTPKVANTIVLTSVLAVVSVKVCLFMTLWVITVLLVMHKLSKTMDKLSFAHSNSRHNILGQLADNISNISTIFSFSNKKYELNRLNKNIKNNFIPTNISVYKYSFKTNIIAAILYWIMLIGLFLYVINLRTNNLLSSGDVVYILSIGLKINWESWLMVQKLPDFMKNLGDLKSSYSILQIPNEEPETLTNELIIKNPSISFINVCFAYEDSKNVFTNLSLQIKASEKVGLVGTSGAGKSSFVSLLLKNFNSNSGQILIDNQDTSLCTADSVRRNIAVIPQDISLFHISILENIRYGNVLASNEEVIEASKLANIHDFILSLEHGYDTLVGERGLKLSGGQRQRIAIARAFLKKAPILVLDEATSSLDTATERIIQESVDNVLENSKNTTVIAIAHRLSTIRHMDRILVFERGRIVEEGKHEDLINKNGHYKKLWEMQKI